MYLHGPHAARKNARAMRGAETKLEVSPNAGSEEKTTQPGVSFSELNSALSWGFLLGCSWEKLKHFPAVRVKNNNGV